MNGLRRARRTYVRAKRVFLPQYRHGLASRYQTLRREAARAPGPRILEIGVASGVSGELLIRAVMTAHGRAEYWGLDVFREGASLELLEREIAPMPFTIDRVRRRLERAGGRVQLIAGDTRETLAVADIPPVDFAFIDGGHSYDTVRSDWQNVQRLLHDHSIVVFDDYTNIDGVQHGGYGVRRVVDEIDRGRWDVEFLRPVNKMRRPYGTLRSQLARVRAKQAV